MSASKLPGFLRIFLLISSAIVLIACSHPPASGLPEPLSLNKPDELICLAGDTGTGEPAQYAVAKAMLDLHCSQVRLLGDLAYPDGIKNADDPVLQKEFWQPYQPLMDNNIPLYLVLGNHDYKLDAGVWQAVAERNKDIVMPARFFSEQNDDGLCIITLDTTWYDKAEYANWRSSETDWLSSSMKKLKPKCSFSLALGHHPLRSSGLHGNATPQMALFLDEHIVGHVDMYAAGHDHMMSDESLEKGTHLLVNGAGGHNTGIKNKSGKSLFMSDQVGLILLRIAAQRPVHTVHYEFWEVRAAADGQWQSVKAHEGDSQGVGIR